MMDKICCGFVLTHMYIHTSLLSLFHVSKCLACFLVRAMYLKKGRKHNGLRGRIKRKLISTVRLEILTACEVHFEKFRTEFLTVFRKKSHLHDYAGSPHK